MIVIVDGKTESIAIQEAKKLEIPVVCIVDSNTNPTLCNYPIPANDDSIRTIQLLVTEVANAIIAVAQKNAKAKEAAEQVADKKEA